MARGLLSWVAPMLKISSRAATGGVSVVALEGRLVGPWVAELRRVVAGTPPGLVRLDLRGVEFADTDGAALLRELRRGGAQLLEASGFLAALIGGDDGEDGRRG
ncbi:MAG TPA: hypothetical protein VHM31_08570 [Polyangia bacterium]|nr:hypothetical protein [Polyangia bacterium]